MALAEPILIKWDEPLHLHNTLVDHLELYDKAKEEQPYSQASERQWIKHLFRALKFVGKGETLPDTDDYRLKTFCRQPDTFEAS